MRGNTGDWNGTAGFKVGEDKGRYNNDKLEYMKYLKIRWIAVLLVAVGTSDRPEQDYPYRHRIHAVFIDPYTQYFPEDDQSELEQMLKNTYGGIGSIITWNTKLKRSMIAEPYEHICRRLP